VPQRSADVLGLEASHLNAPDVASKLHDMASRCERKIILKLIAVGQPLARKGRDKTDGGSRVPLECAGQSELGDFDARYGLRLGMFGDDGDQVALIVEPNLVQQPAREHALERETGGLLARLHHGCKSARRYLAETGTKTVVDQVTRRQRVNRVDVMIDARRSLPVVEHSRSGACERALRYREWMSANRDLNRTPQRFLRGWKKRKQRSHLRERSGRRL